VPPEAGRARRAAACWRATAPGESCDQARVGTASGQVRVGLNKPMERTLAGYRRGERAVLRAVVHGGGPYGSEAELLDLSAEAASHARQVLLDRGDVACGKNIAANRGSVCGPSPFVSVEARDWAARTGLAQLGRTLECQPFARQTLT
jgi:hypothetical protein